MENKNNKSLLIVDDDLDQCKTLKEILEEKGYQAYTTVDPEEAVKLAAKNEFNLVLMDLVLKGNKNGVVIFKEMKKMNPNIKALLFTGYGPEEELRLINDAASAGIIDEILRKPIWPEELIKAVEKHIK